MLSNFNYWMEAALEELRYSKRPFRGHYRKFSLGIASGYVKAALINANKMRDPARKSLCLRVLNWIRADLRRAA